MKTKQFISLVPCVIAGVLWIFIGQNFVLLNVLGGLIGGGGLPLLQFLDSAISPSFQALWFTCATVTLIWLFTTTKKSPMNSAEVREMQPAWWLCALFLVLLGWVYQLFFTVLKWQISGTAPVAGIDANYFQVPPGGWLTLLVLVVFDVALLFWLPTIFASPKSYKLVVPGAMKFLGGR
jgi:drug/metabolite transporter (DMT)-like permease